MTEMKQTGRFAPLILKAKADGRIDEDLVEGLVALLEQELRVRGLRWAPPAYLGEDDQSAWTEVGLRSLAMELADWAIVRRMRGLAAKIDVYGNVDGLVLRNVRSFVTDRQRRADPVGYATYQNLRAAVADGVAAGWLGCDEDDARPRTGSRVGPPGLDAPRLSDRDLVVWLKQTDRWAHLCVTVGRIGSDGRDEAGHVLQQLVEAPCTVRFGELVDAIRSPARAAIAVQWMDDEVGLEGSEGTESWVPLVDPHATTEATWAWQEKVRAVDLALDTVPGRRNRRAGLRALFDEIVRACEDGEAPTQRELGRRLDLAKSTTADYTRILRELFQRSSGA